MSKTDLTPIEEKKKNMDEITEGEKKNKWLSFGISILNNLLIIFFIGIIGANFIYMTTAANKLDNAGESLLEKLLPTNEANYFPEKGVFSGGASCSASKEHSTNWSNLNNIGIGKKGGWPYSMYNNSGFSFTQSFKNWFAKSIADTYITNRGLLQKWLGLFTPDKDDKNIFSNETFQMFIIAPLTILLFPLIIFFIYFSSWFSDFKSGWGFTLVGMFLCYSWITTSTVSIIQCMQYLLTFTVLPLIADYKRVKKIIGCNVKSLSLLFGLLVCSSGFSYLDNTISITMLVVYLFLVIKSFW
jgi:hypothetical protein